MSSKDPLTIQYDIVNVFLDSGSYSGNPLAVFYDSAHLSKSQCQTLARQLNLSETTFVGEVREDGYSVRIFTAQEELPFAGHPTLGTCFALAAKGHFKGCTTVTQRSLSGETRLYLSEAPMSAYTPARVTMQARPFLISEFLSVDAASLAAALGVSPDAAHHRWVRRASCGLPWHWCRIDSLETLRQSNVALDKLQVLYRQLAASTSIQSNDDPLPDALAIFAVVGSSDLELHVEARVFCVANGAVIEDPATGSAALALGLALHAEGMLPANGRYSISQGLQVGAPSQLYGQAEISEETAQVTFVRVGGAVVKVGTVLDLISLAEHNMRFRRSAVLNLTLSSLVHAFVTHHQLERHHPGLPIGLWRDLRTAEIEASRINTASLEAKYPAQWLDVPVDHFDDANNATFGLRYWVDDRFYKPGGPVFCLDGGETSGSGRLAYLDHGILALLSRATNGLSIVLEHRYYGESWPVTDLSTDNLRFLTTAQAIADNAYFTKHATFRNLSHTAQKALKTAKWIHYGGSYAGAKVALLRKLYPDTVFGAIASSAVTAAVTDYWKYFEAIRLHANQACVGAIIEVIEFTDQVIALKDDAALQRLKSLFGLAGLKHTADFGAMLSLPLGAWQAKNWDPKVGSSAFDAFCHALLKPADRASVRGKQIAFVAQDGTNSVSQHLLNYASIFRDKIVPLCRSGSIDDCFGTYDAKQYERTSLNETWRSWTWQYCTEWGYFMPAAPAGVPSLLSRSITLEYASQICRLAFPPGKLISVPNWPNTTMINQHGGFELAADRIAYIDGSYDPWIYATPHSPDVRQRENTMKRPFEVITGGVHHWDENSLRSASNGSSRIADEPREIQAIHQREIAFVKQWLKSA